MISIDIQRAYNDPSLPSDLQLATWATTTVAAEKEDAELTLRITDTVEMAQLNRQFRGKDYPTNVLSFPFELPQIDMKISLLGDVVICAQIVAQESLQQGKLLESHWAHMVVHGCLHLLGYDHIKADEAKTMEALEIKLLAELGFTNPYVIDKE